MYLYKIIHYGPDPYKKKKIKERRKKKKTLSI